MKTLAILTGSFPPSNIVGALRPFRLAKHIGRRGWNVLVLTHPPKLELDQSLLEELDSNYSIKYISKVKALSSRKSVISRRINSVTNNMLQKWIRPDLEIIHVPSFVRYFLEAQQHIDVVLTTSPAHSIHLAGLWIKNRFQYPWVVDFRDPWDDYPRTGVANISNLLERYLERKVIHRSDAVISTTNNYTEILRSRHIGVNAEKFYTITNSFDAKKTFKPLEKSKEKFIICYTGIFYPSKDPYGFFRELRKWFDRMEPADKQRYKDRVEIHLIGSGDQTTRQVINNLKLEANVVFFDRMAHEKAIEKTLQSDMALISTGVGEKTRIGWLPSKLFEYLGCHIPILALTLEGEMAQIIRTTNSGYVVTSQEQEKIGVIIEEMIDHKFNNNKIVQERKFTFNGTDRFEEENVMSEFISIIEKLT